MPYTLAKLPDAPVIVYTVQPGSDPIGEMPRAIAEIIVLLDEQHGKVYLVYDVRAAALGLDDVIRAAMATARGQDALMHHPNLRENVFVATGSFMKMGIQGLANATLGRVRLAQFDTLEGALAHCGGQAPAAGR